VEISNFGALKFDETLFDGNFNEKGKIQIYDKGVHIIYGDFNIKVPFDYIATIEQEKESNLGKVNVKMVIYDMLGSRYNLNMIMSDILFHKLRKRCLEAKEE